MKLYLYLLIITFVSFSSPIAAQKKSQTPNIPTVDFCDLVNNPVKYDKKIVRTKAIFVSSYHGTSIYDYKCESSDSSMSAGGEESKVFKTKKNISKKYDEILNAKLDGSSNRAYVLLVGRFNDWNGGGYGHLSWARFEFAVMAFESIESVASSTPWNEKESEFMAEVEKLRWLNTNLIFSYDKDVLNDTFASDYKLIDLQGKIFDKSKFFEMISAATIRQRATNSGLTFIDRNKALIKELELIAYICPSTILYQYQYSNTYKKQDGQWKLIETQLTSNKSSIKLPCY